MIAGPDDVLGPDTPRRAHNLLAALVEAGEATPEEAARFARMQEAGACSSASCGPARPRCRA